MDFSTKSRNEIIAADLSQKLRDVADSLDKLAIKHRNAFNIYQAWVENSSSSDESEEALLNKQAILNTQQSHDETSEVSIDQSRINVIAAKILEISDGKLNSQRALYTSAEAVCEYAMDSGEGNHKRCLK